MSEWSIVHPWKGCVLAIEPGVRISPCPPYLIIYELNELFLRKNHENLVFFFTPSDLSERNFSQEQRLRVGGLVEEGSVMKSNEGMSVSFRVTDGGASLPVEFNGILPDLFREGQGVVAEGHLINRLFIADEVLAKHDENYMPREVAEKLRENGQWRGDKGVDTP